jgi:7 transmembrane helices usually fused to an inactive transglutaminase
MTQLRNAPPQSTTTPARTRRAAPTRGRRAKVELPMPILSSITLLGVPLLIVIGRLSGMPSAHALNDFLDLSTLPAPLLQHVHQVLFVPLGALIVVFARLVVGVRALGVLSPILLALALPTTGYLPGLGFVSVTLLIVSLAVRPMLKAHGLPYSARVAALLSTVALLMLLPLLVLRQMPAVGASDFAYFPVVALGLVTERFAATWTSEGQRTAVKRTAVTMAEAVAITFVATTLRGVDLLARHPELLLTQIWCVVVLSRYLSVRLFEPRKKPKRRSGKSAAAGARQSHAPATRPAQHKPAQHKPAQETPAPQPSAQQTPAQQTPAQEKPPQQKPAQQMPAQQMAKS